jgi:nicotinic acid phosphoribosyltransferase
MTNLLRTDGYKFSMAQAGFPLRRETFYLSFRKGGWQYIPFNLDGEIRKWLLPLPERDDNAYLRKYDYGLNVAMHESVTTARGLHIRTAPKGTWVYQREPIATINCSSFPASWLEPLALRLFFPIQLATEIKLKGTNIDPNMLLATCDEQADIMRRVIAEVAGDQDPKALTDMIVVAKDEYRNSAMEQAKKLIDIVKEPSRIFEVGMRAATCEGQHQIVLEALKELGIKATSNVALARDLDMMPVGTMGHEHIQRWGNDLDAYRAMRDMRVGTPSYLLDTFDTITSGIPAAIQTALEDHHTFSIRYDSGDKFAQYIYAHGEFGRHGLRPIHILEDGLTDAMTAKFETLREFTELDEKHQVYGYGGFLVSKHWHNPLTRDRVSAVYKLTETSGEARMKFGNETGLGKVSVPGKPVAWRRLRGDGPLSIIGQQGEEVPDNYLCMTTQGPTHGAKENDIHSRILGQLRICNVDTEIMAEIQGDHHRDPGYHLSPETQKLVEGLKR